MDLLLLNAITAGSLVRAHSGASPVLRETNAGWLATLPLPGLSAKVRAKDAVQLRSAASGRERRRRCRRSRLTHLRRT
jgi:hypothetical protein